MWTVHDIFFLAYSSVFPDIHTVFHEVTSINPPILGVDDRPTVNVDIFAQLNFRASSPMEHNFRAHTS